MEWEFKISKTNHVSFQNVNSIPDPQFRAWVQFLNEHSLVAYALCTPTRLNVDQLIELYCHATETSNADGLAFSFPFKGSRTIRITEHDVNRILHFPTPTPDQDFDPDPTIKEIHAFFTLIGSQQPDFNVGEFRKNYLPRHWNFFFHTLIHVFSAKTTNLHGIPLFLQKIGFSIAHNKRINFGHLVLGQILICMGPREYRTLPQNNVECYYPRFLQLILDAVLTNKEKAMFEESETKDCMRMKKNAITQLINKAPLPNVPTVLTPYLNTVPLPLLPRSQQQAPLVIGEPQGIIPQPIPQLDLNAAMNVDPVQEAPIADQEVENQQPLAQVEEPLHQPNEPTQTAPNPTMPLNEPTLSVEGDSALAAPHKEQPSTSTALPLAKRRRTETEATVDSPTIAFLTQNTDISQVDRATLRKSISEPMNLPNKEVLTEITSSPTILRSGTQETKGASETLTERLSETRTLSLSEERVLSEIPTEPVSEHPEPNTQKLPLSNVADQFPSTDFERNARFTVKEMEVHDTQGNVIQTVQLRPSFAYPVQATSSQADDKLDAIAKNIELAAGDARRTFSTLGSAYGTFSGTKQIVDSLKKDAMKELKELRSDFGEVRDSVHNDVQLIHHCQESLAEDVLVVRDSQAMVKDAMNRLTRVESRLNQRITSIEKSTNARLEGIETRLAFMEVSTNVHKHMENQSYGLELVYNMLKKPIMDEVLEDAEEAPLTAEQKEGLETLRAQKAAIDARYEKEKKQREEREEKLRLEKIERFKMYDEDRKKKKADVALKQGVDWEVPTEYLPGEPEGEITGN